MKVSQRESLLIGKDHTKSLIKSKKNLNTRSLLKIRPKIQKK